MRVFMGVSVSSVSMYGFLHGHLVRYFLVHVFMMCLPGLFIIYCFYIGI